LINGMSVKFRFFCFCIKKRIIGEEYRIYIMCEWKFNEIASAIGDGFAIIEEVAKSEIK